MAGAKFERQETGFVDAISRAVRTAKGPIIFKNGARLSGVKRVKYGGLTSSGSEPLTDVCLETTTARRQPIHERQTTLNRRRWSQVSMS